MDLQPYLTPDEFNRIVEFFWQMLASRKARKLSSASTINPSVRTAEETVDVTAMLHRVFQQEMRRLG
jgi:hypothetical protein